MTEAFIGIGGNLDQPARHVITAIRELSQLPESRLIKASSLYESRPQGPQDQPDFVNAVALIETALSAEALLDALQLLEQSHDRVRLRHWGERTLDLDILLFGDQAYHSERLTIPHPHMLERDFVLSPLLEIRPDQTLPNGEPLAPWLLRCADHNLQRLAS